jgi:hypothetical protein
MKSQKQLGIWMNQSVANLIGFSNNKIVTNTIELSPALPEQLENIGSDESLMNNKEQNKLTDYFLNLSKVIKEYNDVLLFGPSSAKAELFHKLKEDSLFDKIEIEIQSTDEMTINQQEAFVKQYFDI